MAFPPCGRRIGDPTHQRTLLVPGDEVNADVDPRGCKTVTVVRPDAQGTIEEAALALHGEKRALARGVLEGAETAGKLSTGGVEGLAV